MTSGFVYSLVFRDRVSMCPWLFWNLQDPPAFILLSAGIKGVKGKLRVGEMTQWLTEFAAFVEDPAQYLTFSVSPVPGTLPSSGLHFYQAYKYNIHTHKINKIKEKLALDRAFG